MADIFFEIGVVIIIAAFLAYIAWLMKQPLIPAYVTAGLLVGPALGLVTNTEIISTTSEIGIAFLLFIVGLEMNLKKLKNVALISSLGGTLQVLLVFIAGAAVAFYSGMFNIREAAYIGLILAFSSTMVVLKLLSDKGQLDTLHGRIIIGFLLMQDVLAILALSVLTTIDNFSINVLAVAIVKGIVVLLAVYLFSRGISPLLFKFAAKSTEILFLMAVAICFFFSMLFAYFGFSIAVGSFAAGVALANLPYTFEIIARVRSLRDFFVVIFFTSLGLELSISAVKNLFIPILAFFFIAVIFKPFVVMAICSAFGYKERPSFLTSASLAQISEFSLIIAAQGMFFGHISKEIFSITVVLAITTIVLTTYLLNFDNQVYQKMKWAVAPFSRLSRKQELEFIPEKLKKDVVLCGYDRTGFSIFKKLREMNQNVLIVDFNPEIIKSLASHGTPCIYGDIADPEIIDRMELKSIRMLVSTIPNKNEGLWLISKTKETNKRATIFVTANTVDDALELYDAGADYVILPHFLGGEHASLLIEDFSTDIKKILKTRFNHIKELRHRKSLGHEHPKPNNHYGHYSQH